MVEQYDNHSMNLYTHSYGHIPKRSQRRYENEFFLRKKMKRYYLKITRGYECKQRFLERLRARLAFLQDTKGEEVPFVYESNASKFDKIIKKQLAVENKEFERLCGIESDDEDSDSEDEIIHMCRDRRYCCCSMWI